jgi:hypothetical protein
MDSISRDRAVPSPDPADLPDGIPEPPPAARLSEALLARTPLRGLTPEAVVAMPAARLEALLIKGKVALPDPRLTPGDVLTTDVKVIEQPGYATKIRHLTPKEQAAVAKEYGYAGPGSAVEYDHLISLELGGSNDIKNIWPEPIAQALVKDKFETWLHRQVVAGAMPLPEVQRRIAANWYQFWVECGKPG